MQRRAPFWLPTPTAVCLLFAFEVLGGRREVDFGEAAPGFLSAALGRFLLIDAPIPWPKGKVKAPDAFHETTPGDFAADREQVIADLDDFAAHPERCTRPHPVFGPMPVRHWGRVVWRHLDHHLRQFGARILIRPEPR